MGSEDSPWEDFFPEYLKPMHAYAYRLTNRKADRAEDLVQDTVVHVLRSGRRPGELDKPLAYVFQTMRRAWIDHIRKERRAQLESLDDPLNNVETKKDFPVTRPTVQRDLENEDLLNAIRQRSARLSAREKLLLDLMADGKSYEEISEMLGEDLRIIRYDCGKLKAKLKYRFKDK